MYGGGGGRALPAKLGIEDFVFLLSSRIYFGICPTIPVVRNVGQTLKRSCSTREKRHREKRGFRLVPPLARAARNDIKGNTVIARGRRPRGYPVEDTASLPGSPQASPS